MARPRTYKTEGIVLKQMPLGEADRILTLYTTDLGKLRAVARGVRRPKSRLAGHLEPLTRATVSVSEGRSLDHIAEAETLQSYRRLREDLELVSKALYLADLVDSFTVDRSPSLALFNLLAGSLARLESARSSDTVLRYFEVQLLHTSGFGPELRECVECRAALEPATHHFCAAAGGILCAGCGPSAKGSLVPLSVNAIKVLRFFQREPPDAVDALEVPPHVLRETARALRSYTTYVLERDLKSARFMNLVASEAPRREPTAI